MKWRHVVPILIAATAQNAIAASNAQTSIEIWTHGDDGLNQRLAGAVQLEIGKSGIFSLSTDQKPGTIYIMLGPTQLEGSDAVASVGISYAPLTGTSGATEIVNCPATDLSVCALEVLNMAKRERAKTSN